MADELTCKNEAAGKRGFKAAEKMQPAVFKL